MGATGSSLPPHPTSAPPPALLSPPPRHLPPITCPSLSPCPPRPAVLGCEPDRGHPRGVRPIEQRPSGSVGLPSDGFWDSAYRHPRAGGGEHSSSCYGGCQVEHVGASPLFLGSLAAALLCWWTPVAHCAFCGLRRSYLGEAVCLTVKFRATLFCNGTAPPSKGPAFRL